MARVRPTKRSTFSRYLLWGIIGGVAGGIAVLALTNVLPSPGDKNFSFEIKNSANGLEFLSVGSSGKKSLTTGHNSPTLEVIKGDTVEIHIINLDSTTEKHDFIIPDIGVHSKVMGYFQADTVRFVADKSGQFTYTSTTHPEAKGILVVQ